MIVDAGQDHTKVLGDVVAEGRVRKYLIVVANQYNIFCSEAHVIDLTDFFTNGRERLLHRRDLIQRLQEGIERLRSGRPISE